MPSFISRSSKAGVVTPPTLGQLWSGLSPAVRASAYLQVGSLLFLYYPGAWPWVALSFFLQHAVLSIAGTVPRSTLLGSNRKRILNRQGIALTFDDGPDPTVTPRVLEILAEKGMQATFFLIGERAAAHPDLVRQIIDQGHHVENHTQHHSSWFCTFLPNRLFHEIREAQVCITKAGVPRPSRFRAPAGVRSPWLQPVLRHLGLELTSWSRRGFDTSQPDPKRVLRRLTRDLSGGEILLLHDGNAGSTTHGATMILEVLPPLLDEIDRLGLKVLPLDSGGIEP